MELLVKDFSSYLQGMLFILVIYHAVSYVFTKDKSFLFYAGYLLLVTIYLIPKTVNYTSDYLINTYEYFFYYANWLIQIFYWMLYSYFSIYFLDITKKNAKLASQIKIYIYTTLVISIIFYLIDVFFFNYSYTSYYFIYFFTPVSLIIVGFFLKVIYNFKDKLNKYFVIGLTFFLGFSIVSLVFSIYDIVLLGYERQIDWFMFGVLLEAITISIGLGYKYELYRKERDNFNLKLIDELNVKLKNEIKQQELISLNAVYQNQINELKINSLHSQMNPHFIFNALNSIKLYIINNDAKQASLYLTKFSKLIRKILEASEQQTVNLKEEIDTIVLYFTIENIRFNNQIKLTTIINDNLDVELIKVPSLILQPFIENAIWHGLSSKKGDKEIILSVNYISNAYFKISIQDNGIGRKKALQIKSDKTTKSKSFGIDLTKERLQNFTKDFKNPFSLTYKDLLDEQKNPLGTKVELKIPIE